MRSNPFYALSASAMLLGCWLLAEALHLEAGRLSGLLVLMAVLQLYEGLLVGLGAFLVRSGRAPRDGVIVLALEAVFLMDATLLATECVTASPRVGTAVAIALATLAAVKLAGARRAAPAILTARATALLAAHALFILALPVVATHLAAARRFDAVALYALWSASLVLPLAREALLRTTSGGTDGAPSRAHRAWAWAPAALVLVHLWSVGYIQTVDFRPAFLAPFLLGLAITSGREQLVRQVALPGLAVLLSLGQSTTLGFAAPFGPLVAPVHLALVGTAAAWAWLAWRDRARWMAVLSVGSAAALLVSAGATPLFESLPRDAYGWGAVAVIAAFVLLATGARRSLGSGDCGPLDSWPPWSSHSPRETTALALCLALLGLLLSAGNLSARTDGSDLLGAPAHPSPVAAALAPLAAVLALAIALRSHARAGGESADVPARRLAALVVLASLAAGLVALMGMSVASGESRPGHEGRVLRSALPAAVDLASPGWFEDDPELAWGSTATASSASPRPRPATSA